MDYLNQCRDPRDRFLAQRQVLFGNESTELSHPLTTCANSGGVEKQWTGCFCLPNKT